jgi:hypothetical protein
MMKLIDRLKEWCKELFQLRSIVPLLTIIGAFLVGFDIPTKWWTNIDKIQVILVLLGMLALDAFVERLGYLKRIEDGIKSLSGIVDKPLFMNRNKLEIEENFPEFVKPGNDLLLIGLSFAGIVPQHQRLWEAKVQEGGTLRFLLLDPESPHVELAAKFHHMSPESLRSAIKATLTVLQQLKDSAKDTKGSIQFRLLQIIPTSSVVVRDGNRGMGVLRCELYLYRADVNQRPVFRLTPANGIDYLRHRDAAEQLWKDSDEPGDS